MKLIKPWNKIRNLKAQVRGLDKCLRDAQARIEHLELTKEQLESKWSRLFSVELWTQPWDNVMEARVRIDRNVMKSVRAVDKFVVEVAQNLWKQLNRQ